MKVQSGFCVVPSPGSQVVVAAPPSARSVRQSFWKGGSYDWQMPWSTG